MYTDYSIRHVLWLALIYCCFILPLSCYSDSDGLADKIKQEKSANEEEMQTAVKEELNLQLSSFSDKLVIIKIKNEYGQLYSTGFLISLDGHTFIYTTKSDLLGSDTISFKTVLGDTLSPTSIHFSTKGDVARLEVDDRTAFTLSTNVSTNMPIGVFGNSEGSGVITETYGRILSESNDVIEITAPFLEGSSGSPVLNAEGEVVAMASHLKNETEENDDSEEDSTTKTRRFCLRIDSCEWVPVNWKEYNKKYGKVYLKHRNEVHSIFDTIAKWIINPYGTYTIADIDSTEMRRWLKLQRELSVIFERNSKITRVTSDQLDDMNKELGVKMKRNAEQLSTICEQYGKKFRFLASSSQDPTGFLQEKYEDYADTFEAFTFLVQWTGEKYRSRGYYRFR